MITYFDTSAFITLLIAEPGTEAAEHIWSAADDLASARLIAVEARSALAAATRAQRLTARQHRTAKRELTELLDQLNFVDITEEVIAAAGTLAEDHALRGYDAVHLAAALAIGSDVMATSDAELGEAAQRLGLHLAHPNA